MATEDTPGGGDESSPFQARSQYDATTADVYQQMIESWIIAPLRVLWDDYRGRIGIIIVTVYVLMGTIGTLFVEVPSFNQGPSLAGPFESMAHPLGTTAYGQDLLGLMVHSTPAMFKMMIAGAIFGNAMGVVVGLVSGYMGGNTDKVLMTITDTMMSIPGLPLLLILAALIEPTNPWLIGIILNIQGWTGLARAIRSQVLPLRKKEYVEASKTIGQPTSSVLTKDVLPEMLPFITMGFMNGATGVIHASVGLYFLGILPFTNQNWGVVLNDAYQDSGALYNLEAAHWLLVPIITITGMTFGLTLLAQAFDQVFNPRVRARHQARKRNEEEENDPRDGDDTGVDSIANQLGD
ncbi:ABC transporter permease [Halomontanus rarus]|uniref:ABC transporter permease n=1 Tax=Halomontanus rarus TaxID=3034020 RepID=UPI0023E84298|nr:ABC transporter permease [Halovivax sp. TS33]